MLVDSFLTAPADYARSPSGQQLPPQLPLCTDQLQQQLPEPGSTDLSKLAQVSSGLVSWLKLNRNLVSHLLLPGSQG